MNTTKKLARILRKLMEYPEAGMQRSFMEYKLWNTRKFYAIPRIFTGVPRNFIEYEETLWNIKKLYEIPRNLLECTEALWNTSNLCLNTKKPHGISRSSMKHRGLPRSFMEYKKLYGRPSTSTGIPLRYHTKQSKINRSKGQQVKRSKD